MDGQTLLVLACVAVAAGYLARRAWRTWIVSKRGCGGGCGCHGGKTTAENAGAPLIPAEQLLTRLRPPA